MNKPTVSDQARRATLEMVQIRLNEMARVESLDPVHYLSTLSSMKSVLMVVESQAPGELPEVVSTLGVVSRSLREAAISAYESIRDSGGSLVH